MLFYGKRMGRRSVLSANAGILSNGFHYYGYDTGFDTTPKRKISGRISWWPMPVCV
jgi:hypothetical protein